MVIETGHHNGNEDSTEELLGKMLGAVPIGEFEDTEMRVITDGIYHACHVKSQFVLDLPDNNHQHGHQTDGLNRIGPDNRLDTASECV